MLMMLPSRDPFAARAALNSAMNCCETRNALFRCESIITSHDVSGYSSNGPLSAAGALGGDPRPALFTRMVGVPKRAAAALMAAATSPR